MQWYLNNCFLRILFFLLNKLLRRIYSGICSARLGPHPHTSKVADRLIVTLNYFNYLLLYLNISYYVISCMYLIIIINIVSLLFLFQTFQN